MSGARHLYVHLPFCAQRCGYCDFVTVVGRGEQHRAYVDALLRELDLERTTLAPQLDTIFLGGGTPTFTALPELVRLLEALPRAAEVTVEANPETVTPELAHALREAGVTRVSLGAQTFRPELLRVLERVAGPDDVRRAVHHLRDARFDNISLDLIYGIPGQSASDLASDLGDALTLEPELARALREAGVTRVSLGAQTFRPELLRVLERVAGPDDVRRAVHHLRDARFDNISLDLIYGIPGQSASDLASDLGDALALEPEHLSCYELEAKPGTRFTHAWGEELGRQADAMEDYFERVVVTLTGAGYRWYETANFCRADDARDLRSQHNLAYWLGRDYLGIGIGAVSTIENSRWRNAPRLGRYLEALAAGRGPERELEDVGGDVKARERVMLGLRLDEPLPLAGLRHALDPAGLARVESLGLAERSAETLALTERGRYLGGAVTAELLA